MEPASSTEQPTAAPAGEDPPGEVRGRAEAAVSETRSSAGAGVEPQAGLDAAERRTRLRFPRRLRPRASALPKPRKGAANQAPTTPPQPNEPRADSMRPSISPRPGRRAQPRQAQAPDPAPARAGADRPRVESPPSGARPQAADAAAPPAPIAAAQPAAEPAPVPAARPRTLLELRGLHHRRGQGEQAFHVELPALTLAAGEIIALTGQSGCGKSTALELLALIAQPDRAGHFRLALNDADTHDIAALWDRNAQRELARLRARALGFVLQTGGLLPYLTVAQNIQINRRLLGMPAADADLDAIIKRLEIGKQLDKKPHQLSIGQQQRASIARALAHKPRLLLADEPTSALDPRLGARVMEVMLGLVEQLGVSVIIATHAHAQVRSLGLREVQAEPLADRLGSRFVEDTP
jgi:putative ABC transport system ATP-binding protein